MWIQRSQFQFGAFLISARFLSLITATDDGGGDVLSIALIAPGCTKLLQTKRNWRRDARSAVRARKSVILGPKTETGPNLFAFLTNTSYFNTN